MFTFPICLRLFASFHVSFTHEVLRRGGGGGHEAPVLLCDGTTEEEERAKKKTKKQKKAPLCGSLLLGDQGLPSLSLSLSLSLSRVAASWQKETGAELREALLLSLSLSRCRSTCVDTLTGPRRRREEGRKEAASERASDETLRTIVEQTSSVLPRRQSPSVARCPLPVARCSLLVARCSLLVARGSRLAARCRCSALLRLALRSRSSFSPHFSWFYFSLLFFCFLFFIGNPACVRRCPAANHLGTCTRHPLPAAWVDHP